MAAFPTSYVSGPGIAAALVGGVNLDTNTIKVALYGNTVGNTPSPNATESWNITPWHTGEVTYSGATPSAAQALTNPTVAAASNKVTLKDSVATMAWTGATFSAQGALVYSDTHASDLVLAAINFGNLFPVTANTFTITWDSTNGIYYFSYGV